MYCPKCGQKIEEDTRFCPFCGTRIQTEQREETSPAGQQQAGRVQDTSQNPASGTGYGAQPGDTAHSREDTAHSPRDTVRSPRDTVRSRGK